MNQRPLRPCSKLGCPSMTRAKYCDRHAMATRPCAAAGCPSMVPVGKQFCPEHQAHRERERGSAASRGYDRDWKAVRLAYLREHPICEDCELKGDVVPAALVHHVDPIRQGGARLDAGNLRALCEPCHARAHGKLDRAAEAAKKPAPAARPGG